MSYVCVCGHAHDEHDEHGFQGCEVEGCPCVAYDDDPDGAS